MKKLAITLVLALFVSAGAAQPQHIMNPGQTPGDALYGLDRAMESAELAFASAIGGKERAAMVRANHAEERLAEAQKLVEENRSEEAEELMNEYNRNINAVRNASAELNDTEFQQRVQNMTRKHVQVLERVQQKVPEQAQQGIQRALQNSQKAVPGPRAGPPEGVGPGNGMPGQQPPAPGNDTGEEAGPGNETGEQSPPENRTEEETKTTSPETEEESSNDTGSGNSTPVV